MLLARIQVTITSIWNGDFTGFASLQKAHHHARMVSAALPYVRYRVEVQKCRTLAHNTATFQSHRYRRYQCPTVKTPCESQFYSTLVEDFGIAFLGTGIRKLSLGSQCSGSTSTSEYCDYRAVMRKIFASAGKFLQSLGPRLNYLGIATANNTS